VCYAVFNVSVCEKNLRRGWCWETVVFSRLWQTLLQRSVHVDLVCLVQTAATAMMK
jgi:hypothetical protein